MKVKPRFLGPLVAWGALAVLFTPVGLRALQSQERVDSTELRVRQRLEALGRPPGTFPDSAALDSARVSRRGSARGGAPPLMAGDSLVSELMDALEGYDRTSYEAKRTEFLASRQELFLHADSTVRASIMRPDGLRLSADSLIYYDQTTQILQGDGEPTYTPAEGDPVDSRKLVFDTRGRIGSAFDARSKYAQGGTTWNVNGDLPLVTGSLAYGDHARFTSCNLETPHYHFEAGQLKIDNGNVLVARSVKLYFADVPVFWLPFVFQSLSGGRASGILAPRFSVNDIVRTGGNYRRRVSNVGFYWSINDYMDATTALDWFDDNYTAITGNLRYRWLRQFLDGSLSYRQFFRAEGGKEMSLDASSRWEMSERSRFDLSAQYATSTSFVRRNSFDPREVTGQIRSQGGFSRRFDWGSLNVSADRSQSLSDDRVDMSLPRIGLSLSPITLFAAPTARASWYNNVAWGGSAQFSRRSSDRPPPEEGFSFSKADIGDLNTSVTSNFTMGRFSLAQSLRLSRGTVMDVPTDSLVFFPGMVEEEGMPAFLTSLGQAALGAEEGSVTDISTTDLTWSTSINYQQTLIGTTTLTPRLSINGQMRRADTVAVAQSFVAAPTRVAFGAALKADLYGFYGGIAGFEAVRHKLTPSITYDWSPEIMPTELQQQVFGTRALQPKSVFSITLNQTWEGKRPETVGEQPEPEFLPLDTIPADSAMVADSLAMAQQLARLPQLPSAEERGLQRAPRSQIMNLLSIRTSAVRYDFVEADSVDSFLAGFQNTTLQNQISSDFLRGLSITMTHDLFEDVAVEGGDDATTERKFKPHLSQLNFGFSLNSRSTVLRWLGLGGGDESQSSAVDDSLDPALEDPFATTSVTDETTILPGRATNQAVQQARRSRGAGWNANLSYALTRPRLGGTGVSEIVNVNFRMAPTNAWEMSWSTAYDLEASQFNDHRIRLTRDLHRWQAHFDFLKTSTGNWTFRFEVSLLDNRDLHFDYEQRSDAFIPVVR